MRNFDSFFCTEMSPTVVEALKRAFGSEAVVHLIYLHD